ncbi:MAG: hypothetical protein QOD09_1657 [Bradyrhizobium sp.]|nr:hypothetical protein [Bradyrhizobium sp.]
MNVRCWHKVALEMQSPDGVVQGLSEVPVMQDVDRWGVLTIGTGPGNPSSPTGRKRRTATRTRLGSPRRRQEALRCAASGEQAASVSQANFLVAAPCLPRHPRLELRPTEGGKPPVMAPGEVAEWSIAPHSKCGIGASLSGVRIPPSPPFAPCFAGTGPMNKVTGNREGVQDLGRAIARLHQVDAAGRDRRN